MHLTSSLFSRPSSSADTWRVHLVALQATGLSLVLAFSAAAQESHPETVRPLTESTEQAAPVDSQEGSDFGAPSADVPAAGAMVFVSPETGELVSVPAAGQMQRLLALGRSLASQRARLVTEGDGNDEPQQVLFATSVGIGARLDDRFLHSLQVRFDATGHAHWSCSDSDHVHQQASREPPETGSFKPPPENDSSLEAPES